MGKWVGDAVLDDGLYPLDELVLAVGRTVRLSGRPALRHWDAWRMAPGTIPLNKHKASPDDELAT